MNYCQPFLCVFLVYFLKANTLFFKFLMFMVSSILIRRIDHENNTGFVTLEAFMLARQEEERRQQQEFSRPATSSTLLPLPPQIAPRTSGNFIFFGLRSNHAGKKEVNSSS